MKIIKAKKKDIAQIITMVNNTISHCYKDFIKENELKEYVSSGCASRFIEPCINDCYIAVKDDDILGLVIFSDDSIHMLLVNHEHLKEGVASKLMKFAEDKLFQTHEVIKLDTIVENNRAMALYNKLGWNQYKTEAGDKFDINIAFFNKTK